jgi:hypothetical protein
MIVIYSPNRLSANNAPKKGVVYATAVEMETYEEARMDGMLAFQSSLYLVDGKERRVVEQERERRYNNMMSHDKS